MCISEEATTSKNWWLLLFLLGKICYTKKVKANNGMNDYVRNNERD